MRRVLTAAFLLAFTPALALAQDLPGEPRADSGPRFHGWSGPKPKTDCTCRHREGRAELGEKVCILQGDHRVLAECRMILNNTSWRILDQDCEPPSS